MKKKRNHKDIPTAEEMRRYLSGEMTDAEKNALERKFQASAFVSDAEEGLSTLSARQFTEDINKLRKQAKGKTQKNTSLWSGPLQIAAGIIIACISSWLLLEYFDVPEQIVKKQQQPIEEAKHDDIITYQESLDMDNKDAAKHQEGLESKRKEIEQAQRAIAEKAYSDRGKNVKEKKIDEVPIDEDNTISNNANTIDNTADAYLDIEEPENIIAESQPEFISPTEQKAVTATDELITINPDSSILTPTEPLSLVQGNVSGVKKTRIRGMSSFKATSTKQFIAGRVIHSSDLEPLPGVNVVLKGTTTGVVTDIEGRFQIPIVDSANNTLVVSFIGYETTEFEVKNYSFVEITLDDDITQLSEVVVSGYGSSEDEPTEIIKAEPIGGFRAFRKFIKENMQYPSGETDKRTVKVEFTVEEDGSIIEIQVLDFPGKAFEKEAVRLIKEGPKWLPAKVNGIAQQEKVKIRMRFKPSK